MRELPILFSAPMVQAIQELRKNMTRRVIKPQPFKSAGKIILLEKRKKMSSFAPDKITLVACGDNWGIESPHQPGDLLYVKENTWIWCKKERNGLTSTGRPKYRYIPVGQHVVYQLDHPSKPEWRIDDNPEHDWRLKVARYMPKWAARIRLEVTSIRVERLQEITEEDAEKEGVGYCPYTHRVYNAYGYGHDSMCYVEDDCRNPNRVCSKTYRENFAVLWDSLNLKRGYGWDANPWVWVTEFKKVKP